MSAGQYRCRERLKAEAGGGESIARMFMLGGPDVRLFCRELNSRSLKNLQKLYEEEAKIGHGVRWSGKEGGCKKK